jgi:hypothetical protein
MHTIIFNISPLGLTVSKLCSRCNWWDGMPCNPHVVCCAVCNDPVIQMTYTCTQCIGQPVYCRKHLSHYGKCYNCEPLSTEEPTLFFSLKDCVKHLISCEPGCTSSQVLSCYKCSLFYFCKDHQKVCETCQGPATRMLWGVQCAEQGCQLDSGGAFFCNDCQWRCIFHKGGK